MGCREEIKIYLLDFIIISIGFGKLFSCIEIGIFKNTGIRCERNLRTPMADSTYFSSDLVRHSK